MGAVFFVESFYKISGFSLTPQHNCPITLAEYFLYKPVMVIRILFENEYLRFAEFTKGETNHFELKVMHWSVNDTVEDLLIEKYNIIEDYISFDNLSNETRTTHHYGASLDSEGMLKALKEISAQEKLDSFRRSG